MPIIRRRVFSALAFLSLLAVFAAIACGDDDDSRSPTATPDTSAGSASSTPDSYVMELTPTATPTEEPTPAPTETPEEPAPSSVAQVAIGAGQGLIVGGPATTYTGPSSRSGAVGSRGDFTTINITGSARGENWIVGDQNWPMAFQDWGTLWYRLDDGSYVYSAFVFIPRAGETAPLQAARNGNRSITIDLGAQTAYAMVGSDVVYRAAITSGKRGFETPTGNHRVQYRVKNERMTSSQAGIDDPAERYDVHRVLFTQYFAAGGYALHLNYWQPYSVFGRSPSSHGCVGILLHDAQWFWMFGGAGVPVTVRSSGGPVAAPANVPPAAPEQTPAPSPSPTESPQPTPSASTTPTASSPTPAPTVTRTATPPPPAPTATPSRDLQIVAISGAPPGGTARVEVQTAPNAACSLRYFTPAGAPAGPPNGDIRAGPNGRAVWQWQIAADTPPGPGSVNITCGQASATAPITIG